MCLHVTVSHPRIINLLHALTTALLESGTFYVAMRREFFEVCVPKVLIGVFQEGENLFFFNTRCSQYRSISLSTIFILMLQTSFCLAAAVGALNSERLQFTMALHCLLHLSSKQWRWIEEHFTTPD